MEKINKIFFGIIINIFLFTGLSFSQEAWVAPNDANSKVNPVIMNSDNADLGSEIFKKNCQSCHGEPGLNNNLPLIPPPVDITSDQMQANTDGSLFYKITTGKGGMPTFSSVLSEDERWKIVTFIKSFSSDIILEEENGEILNDVNIKLSYDIENYIITATVTGKNENSEVKTVTGEKLNFYVKRYFGNLTLNTTTLKTNSNGSVKIDFPKDLPGDTIGNLNLYVELDSKKYKNISITEEIRWGVPTIPEDIMNQGAMWGNSSMTPWWIVMLYVSIAGGVWIAIVYVLLLVRKIKKLGNKG
jgi:cytochrome c5/ribosomal protein L35AE/L33A